MQPNDDKGAAIEQSINDIEKVKCSRSCKTIQIALAGIFLPVPPMWENVKME